MKIKKYLEYYSDYNYMNIEIGYDEWRKVSTMLPFTKHDLEEIGKMFNNNRTSGLKEFYIEKDTHYKSNIILIYCNGYCIFIISKSEDEWYYIGNVGKCKYYKCDELKGLLMKIDELIDSLYEVSYPYYIRIDN